MAACRGALPPLHGLIQFLNLRLEAPCEVASRADRVPGDFSAFDHNMCFKYFGGTNDVTFFKLILSLSSIFVPKRLVD